VKGCARRDCHWFDPLKHGAELRWHRRRFRRQRHAGDRQRAERTVAARRNRRIGAGRSSGFKVGANDENGAVQRVRILGGRSSSDAIGEEGLQHECVGRNKGGQPAPPNLFEDTGHNPTASDRIMQQQNRFDQMRKNVTLKSHLSKQNL
jgi:hypothetical protein